MATPALCSVYGTLKFPTGVETEGNEIEIFVTPQNALPQFSQGNMLAGKSVLLTTDTYGYFEIPLMIGSLVTIHVKQANFQCQFMVPDAEEADIESIPGVSGVMRKVENPF